MLAACGGNPATEPPTEGGGSLVAAGSVAQKPPAAPGGWFTVDEAEERRLEGQPVYHQGPQRPPALLDRRPVILPLSSDEIPTDPLLVQAVVGDAGRVVRARILRGVALPSVEGDVLTRRLAAALRGFRFRPARLDGRAVAVYYNLSLAMTGEPGTLERRGEAAGRRWSSGRRVP